MLEGLALAGPTWQTPPTTIGDGETVRSAAIELGMEGVVAKRLDSAYQPGRRSDAWRKVKITHGQELVVGGWLPGAGRLDGRLGSLLVGYYDDGVLRYAGRVGFWARRAQAQRARSESSRRSRATRARSTRPRSSPDPHWVEPELVVDVRFQNWTGAGILRAPRYRGLRDDKEPSEVVPRDPVEHMWTQRVTLRHPGVLEVVGRIACHPDALHHRPRAHVARCGERHDLVETDRVEPELQCRPRALARVSVAPVITRKPPSHFDRGRERRVEGREIEADEPDARRNAGNLDRPQPVAALVEPRFERRDLRLAFAARQGGRKVLPHSGSALRAAYGSRSAGSQRRSNSRSVRSSGARPTIER